MGDMVHPVDPVHPVDMVHLVHDGMSAVGRR